MRNRWIVGALVVACGVGFAAGRAFTDDQVPSPEEMKKAFEELGKVGDQHKRLTALAGTYDLKLTGKNMETGAEETSTGTATFTPIFGGRFIRQEVKSTMHGKPFEGLGYLGYENSRGKYVSFWMDDMSTGWMTGTGVEDPKTKAITYSDSWFGPGGVEMKTRDVITLKSDKEFAFEMYGSFVPGQPEEKWMTIVYTKR